MRAAALPALLLLPACAADYSGLRIEQRPAENIIRIANDGSSPATLHYTHERPFGDYQMLRVRFRDARGRIVPLDRDGWWSPLVYSSNLYPIGAPVPRRTLRIPARGHVDLPRDLGALTRGVQVATAAPEPCAVQVKLLGYPGRRAGQRPIEVVSEWQPAACPAPGR